MVMAVGVEKLVRLPNWPLMLTEDQAAVYVGLKVAAFQRLVEAGELPKPRRLGVAVRWCRIDIDRHFVPTDAAGAAVDAPDDGDVLLAELAAWSRP
jgi:predicted DNA-binding transcriptional regulator AlpA